MWRYRWYSALVVAVVLGGCGKSLPVLDGIDMMSWKNDKNGCGGQRAEMMTAMDAQKDKLLSLSEIEVVEVLGKPDQNELYKRNQKFFYYFVEPAAACEQSGDEDPMRLIVRFNAVGLAKEIILER